MFCPKCGSILMPKKVGSKTVMACSCGYKSGDTELKLGEKVEKSKEVEVIESEREHLPKITADCPKCGFNEAYFWEVQTRAADEPATKFMKCVKCKHIWRDYL
ncbi:MAG: transcription factor S [Nanoarchaeota archaeon]|nr:transcription factor S [Nanoarchaeota archaeon]